MTDHAGAIIPSIVVTSEACRGGMHRGGTCKFSVMTPVKRLIAGGEGHLQTPPAIESCMEGKEIINKYDPIVNTLMCEDTIFINTVPLSVSFSKLFLMTAMHL